MGGAVSYNCARLIYGKGKDKGRRLDVRLALSWFISKALRYGKC